MRAKSALEAGPKVASDAMLDGLRLVQVEVEGCDRLRMQEAQKSASHDEAQDGGTRTSGV